MEPITVDTGHPPETPAPEGQASLPDQPRCSVCCDLRRDIFYAKNYRAGMLRSVADRIAYGDLVSARQEGCVICSLMLCACEKFGPRKPPVYVQLGDWGAKDRGESLREFHPLKIEARYELTLRENRDWEKRKKKEEEGFDGMDDGEEEEDDIDEQLRRWPGEREPKRRRYLMLQLFEEQDFPVGLPIGPARAVSRHSKSSTCMNRLSSWLSQCRDNHEACSDSPDVTLPRRVISVGSETMLPRLYVPKEGTRGQYAALSHCWGGDVPLKTMTANLEEHRRGIPEDRLPKTFLDAVHIARRLQIPFLWIDSLCIVQGDHEDWVRETERMGSYYSGALLTIAASRAANSSEGCFHERPQKAWKSFAIGKHEFGLANDVHVRRAPTYVIGRLEHNFKSDRHGEPQDHLAKRAWAVQEWYLSKRIVRFTDGEMTWECNEKAACECSVNDSKDRIRGFKQLPLKRLVEDFPALYDQCVSIMHMSSKRAITHETDRLMAVAGVAQVFSKVTKDEYVCGIWKNCPPTLLWGPIATSPLRQDKFYAPSWSWASIASGTTAPGVLPNTVHYEHRNLAEILHIDSTPATTNRFGPVKQQAKLTIRGPAFFGRIDDGFNMRHFCIEEQCTRGLIIFDFPPVKDDADPINKRLNADKSLFLDPRRKPDLRPGDEFIILLIRQTMCERMFSVGGLVLKAVGDLGSVYQRVGRYGGQYEKPAAPGWDDWEERTVTLV